MSPETGEADMNVENRSVEAVAEPVAASEGLALKPKHAMPKWQVMVYCWTAAVVALIIGVFMFFGLKKLADEAEVAILKVTPTVYENEVLGADSHFIVETQNGSVEKVREAVYLEPAIDYEIVEKRAGSEYEIVPASKLADNTVFNVDAVKNNTVSYKWAFQTKKDLSVARVYPANGANYVDEKSVIELAFSYPNVEDVDEHFKISPEVAGELEQVDRVWRFTPSQPLAKNMTYTITVTAGLSYGDEVMTSDFTSTFSTNARSVATASETVSYITLDKISTFQPTENPVVVFSNSEAYNEVVRAEVEKIGSADEFIKYLNGEQVAKTTLGSYEIRKVAAKTTYGEKSVVLNQTLPIGYYVIKLMNNSGQALVAMNAQVNDIAAFAFEAERDAVVWVAENGQLKSGVNVNYKGVDYQTGENGLLKLQSVSDFSSSLSYMKIGSGNPLVVGLENYENNLYPTGYIYTDRPLYKPTDTIKVWGYVPLDFFADAPKLDGFSVAYGDLKKRITVNADGTYETELSLVDYKDTEYETIKLVYNDRTLAWKEVTVENYSLENYSYEFQMAKNFVVAGDNLNFSVKVTHVTGFPAANKDVVVTYDKHDYYGTTNAYGEANFSVPTAREVATWEYASGHTTGYLDVTAGGADYNKYSTSMTVYIFRNNLDLTTTQNKDASEITIKGDLLNLSKDVVLADWGLTGMERSPFNGNATVSFYEVKMTRRVSGSYYNAYTKENEPTYSYNSSTTQVKTVQGRFENGELKVKYPTDFKEADENTSYQYYMVMQTQDSAGRPAFEQLYYHYVYRSDNVVSGDAIVDYWGCDNCGIGWDYNLYRFKFKDQNSTATYGLGDKIELQLRNSKNEAVKVNGQLLAVAYKERVIETKMTSDSSLQLEFGQNLYPGASVAGAYFENGKFHRVKSDYYDYKTELSELTVKIETDKEDYEPGDTVKAKVIVERADGSRASGKVHLSVVNEAVFNAVADSTDLLQSIYANKYFKSYLFSSYRDYDLSGGDGGKGAGGGGARRNFGDTLAFEMKDLQNGEAEFSFRLNDSITSFRLTAHAVESDGEIVNAGVGTKKIASYLPLSITTVQVNKAKNTDDLVVNASAPVAGSQTVHYTFKIENKEVSVDGRTGQTVYANLGKLELGDYKVEISARDDAGNTDALEYPVKIVETTQNVAIEKTAEVGSETTITPERYPVKIEVYNGEAKVYRDYLARLESNFTARLDTQIAYYEAQALRRDVYADDWYAPMSAPDFSRYYTDEGVLRALENAEGDYVLTALANYYSGEYFSKLKRENFAVELDDDDETYLQKLMVLASFKEPVLADLRAMLERAEELSDDELVYLGLAFAMIGDYDSAKEVYGLIGTEEDETSEDWDARKDLLAILVTFVDKESARKAIDELIESDPAADYLNFAILSFFENNEKDWKTVAKVTIGNDEREIKGPLVLAQSFDKLEFENLKLSTKAKDMYVTYSYQGRLSEVSGHTDDLKIELAGERKVGKTVELVVDVDALAGKTRNGELNVALPAGMRFSGTFTGADGLYLSRNGNDYVRIAMAERFNGKEVRIPLYVTAPGNYEFEPVVFIHEGEYHLSNSLTFEVAE